MDAFTALSDPTRRQIVERLLAGERSAGEIAADFAISQPAVSQHLKSLRQAGLVTVRAEAQRRYYRLDPKGLAELDAWFERVRRFWSSSLDELEKALAKPQ